MKIAITADVPDEKSPVSPIFGRCGYYAIYDTTNDKLEFIPNQAGMYARGAGIQAAQFLVSQGVSMVITSGVVGPNSSMVLSQGGARIVNNFGGTVRDAIEMAKSGHLEGRETRAPYPMYAPPQQVAPFPMQMTKEEEIKMLEEEKNAIEERLKEVKKRLKELKK